MSPLQEWIIDYFELMAIAYFANQSHHYHHYKKYQDCLVMEACDSEQISAEIVQFDCHLHTIFHDLENSSKIHLSTTPTVFEWPEHYDPKDIEKDYKSECNRGTRKIKKRNRAKVGVNIVGKARKERKNKLYIQMLENRIFELQKEVDSLKKINKMSKQTLIKNHDSEQIVNGFFVNRQRHYQKLMTYVKQNKIDEQKFNEEYSMLRIRQGAVGKDRIKVINYYFKELSEIMITDLQKYVLKTAKEETDLFDPNFANIGTVVPNVEQWRKDLVQDIQLNYQKVMKISEIKEELLVERTKMESCFAGFYEMKLKILESSRRMEMIYDRLNEAFSPRQIAKVLCLIEKYKFQKGFSIQDIFKDVFNKLQQQQKQCYNPENLYQIV